MEPLFRTLFLALFAARATVAATSMYQTGRGEYQVISELRDMPQLANENASLATHVNVFYPMGDGPFPLLAFGHGVGRGGDALERDYGEMLQSIASFGFVVVATQACPTNYCPNFADEILKSIELARDLTQAEDMVFDRVFLKNVGVFGHSMGGTAAITSLRVSDQYSILASAPLFPCVDGLSDSVNLPVMYITGEADRICNHDSVYQFFTRNTPSPVASFLNMKHTDHNGPVVKSQTMPPWVGAVAAFFKCHLVRSESACEYVYGLEDNICDLDKLLTVTSGCQTRGTPAPPEVQSGTALPVIQHPLLRLDNSTMPPPPGVAPTYTPSPDTNPQDATADSVNTTPMSMGLLISLILLAISILTLCCVVLGGMFLTFMQQQTRKRHRATAPVFGNSNASMLTSSTVMTAHLLSHTQESEIGVSVVDGDGMIAPATPPVEKLEKRPTETEVEEGVGALGRMEAHV